MCLAAVQAGIAALAWAGMYVYAELPVTFVWLYWRLEQAPGWHWLVRLVLAMVVMLPPAVLMGASFPLLVRAVSKGGATLSRSVGRVYAINTVGAIAGAALGGLLLLPAMNVSGSVMLAVSLNLLAAAIALWTASLAGGSIRWGAARL